MPQTGGPINRPKPVKAPKPKKDTGFQVGLTETSIAPKQQQKAGNNKTVREVAQRNNTPIESAGGAGAKYETTALKQGTATKKARQDIKGTVSNRKQNAKTFGFDTQTAPTRRKRSGGTAGGGGSVGGAITRDRTGGRRDTGLEGGNDGGRLGGAFRDRDIVGSRNDITDFDGTGFSGGGGEAGGGGGGSGSSLAGRESVGKADIRQGESVEDVVYGVKRRSRKVSRARGE